MCAHWGGRIFDRRRTEQAICSCLIEFSRVSNKNKQNEKKRKENEKRKENFRRLCRSSVMLILVDGRDVGHNASVNSKMTNKPDAVHLHKMDHSIQGTTILHNGSFKYVTNFCSIFDIQLYACWPIWAFVSFLFLFGFFYTLVELTKKRIRICWCRVRRRLRRLTRKILSTIKVIYRFIHRWQINVEKKNWNYKKKKKSQMISIW